MKAIKYICIAALVAGLSACSYDIQPDKLYLSEDGVKDVTADGKIYHLNELLETFMTDAGNYLSDTSLYRLRAYTDTLNGYYLFSIDTLPSTGPGIYIRGRVCTDDYGGNWYKSMVIQEIVNGKQQNLRLSIDLGSASGMYPRGQELLIRCNGLAIGRYANQPQLCVPSYNNNTNASSGNEKVGWNPGRIPAPLCRQNFMMIGTPDEKALHYDTLSIAECYNGNAYKYYKLAPYVDGRLVVIKGVWFDGTESNYGDTLHMRHYDITTKEGDPTVYVASGERTADVFAPTTGNVGHPQSRFVTDGKDRILVSSSEYAKYAHFHVPYEYFDGKVQYGTFKGNVRGVLGCYIDRAQRMPDTDAKWRATWSVTISDLSDIDFYRDYSVDGNVPNGTKWGLYVRPDDGHTVDLRKEWAKGVNSKRDITDEF